MLIYHPAFDIYNCVFRMLQLLFHMKREEVELDRLRIWDFYLTFPNEARLISYPSSLSELKKIFRNKAANPYEDLIDSKRIFERMKSFQISALKSIASYGLIDSKLLTKNIVRRTEKEIPKELADKFADVTIEKANVIKLMIGFWEIPLYGKFGLKDRTGLIEFKYDQR
ncbi:MAG: ABC-three component system middle component 5 [Saprospiraceae bacterium]